MCTRHPLLKHLQSSVPLILNIELAFEKDLSLLSAKNCSERESVNDGFNSI